MESLTIIRYLYLGGIDLLPEDRLRGHFEGQGVRLQPGQLHNGLLPDLCLFDQLDENTLKALESLFGKVPHRIVAMHVGGRELHAQDYLKLMRLGAGDVLSWFQLTRPANAVAMRLLRWKQVDAAIRSPWVQKNLFGASPQWIARLRELVDAALFSKLPILVTGETGTGKEMASKLIHHLDPRPGKGDLALLDCTTVVEGLATSEFFGHERGAFTSANQAREGIFSLADGATLFIDEVGELPIGLQAELLRVIQEKTVKKIGSHERKPINFRLVCATNRDLTAERKDGRFRNDLYHRIAGSTIHLPALRERPEDILPLAEKFAREILDSEVEVVFDHCIKEILLTREYSGNVRELKQLVHNMAYRHSGLGPITIGDYPFTDGADKCYSFNASPLLTSSGFETCVHVAILRGKTMRDISDLATEAAIRIALRLGGNMQAAADMLDVCKRTLELRRANHKREMHFEHVETAPVEAVHAV